MLSERNLMSAKTYDHTAIETLANAEADAWFVSDVLVASSLRHALFEKETAIRLLKSAIDELSSCSEPAKRWQIFSSDSSNNLQT
jgi:hypothetical protein